MKAPRKSPAEKRLPVLTSISASEAALRTVIAEIEQSRVDALEGSRARIERAVAQGSLTIDADDAAMMRIAHSMTPLASRMKRMLDEMTRFRMHSTMVLEGRGALVFDSPATEDRLACDHIAAGNGVIYGERLNDGRMLVRAGSLYNRDASARLFDIHRQTRDALEAKGAVGPVEGDEEGRMVFLRDCTFESPQVAAAVATGRRAGAIEWRRVSYPALCVLIEACGLRPVTWLRRASRNAASQIDITDLKWEGRDPFSDECMIAEDDFRYGGLPFSVGSKRQRVQARVTGGPLRERTNALRAAVLREVAPGGRPLGRGRFFNDDTRVVVGTRAFTNPWQFQVREVNLLWASRDLEEGQNGRVVLICGDQGYALFEAHALVHLLDGLWHADDSGHNVAWIEATMTEGERLELRPVTDRTKMLPLYFVSADPVALP